MTTLRDAVGTYTMDRMSWQIDDYRLTVFTPAGMTEHDLSDPSGWDGASVLDIATLYREHVTARQHRYAVKTTVETVTLYRMLDAGQISAQEMAEYVEACERGDSLRACLRVTAASGSEDMDILFGPATAWDDEQEEAVRPAQVAFAEGLEKLETMYSLRGAAVREKLVAAWAAAEDRAFGACVLSSEPM